MNLAGVAQTCSLSLRFYRLLRSRFFAEFTLSRQSEILRIAQNDGEGLSMIARGSE